MNLRMRSRRVPRRFSDPNHAEVSSACVWVKTAHQAGANSKSPLKWTGGNLSVHFSGLSPLARTYSSGRYRNEASKFIPAPRSPLLPSIQMLANLEPSRNLMFRIDAFKSRRNPYPHHHQNRHRNQKCTGSHYLLPLNF
jgi:hypothetical protein